MKTTVQILEEAKVLIDTPDKWGQGFYASYQPGRLSQNEIENACLPMEAGATRFCIKGAMTRTDGVNMEPYHVVTEDHPTLKKALRFVEAALPPQWYGEIAKFNDAETTTHTDVMAVLDKAIELAKLARAKAEEQQ